MKTCSEIECKYYTELFEEDNLTHTFDDNSFCTKHNKYIPEAEPCEDYEKARKCFNCEHAKEVVYETGTIDSVDYHCKLQEGKSIYSDLAWNRNHYIDFPECPINKWKEK